MTEPSHILYGDFCTWCRFLHRHSIPNFLQFHTSWVWNALATNHIMAFRWNISCLDESELDHNISYQVDLSDVSWLDRLQVPPDTPINLDYCASALLMTFKIHPHPVEFQCCIPICQVLESECPFNHYDFATSSTPHCVSFGSLQTVLCSLPPQPGYLWFSSYPYLKIEQLNMQSKIVGRIEHHLCVADQKYEIIVDQHYWNIIWTFLSQFHQYDTTVANMTLVLGKKRPLELHYVRSLSCHIQVLLSPCEEE